jgi:hypothetical protein
VDVIWGGGKPLGFDLPFCLVVWCENFFLFGSLEFRRGVEKRRCIGMLLKYQRVPKRVDTMCAFFKFHLFSFSQLDTLSFLFI